MRLFFAANGKCYQIFPLWHIETTLFFLGFMCFALWFPNYESPKPPWENNMNMSNIFIKVEQGVNCSSMSYTIGLSKHIKSELSLSALIYL